MTTTIDFSELAGRFLDAQLHGDRRAALALLVDAVASGARVVDLQAQVVRAAQEQIGRMWQDNRISIAQEHLATGISQLALARLFEHAPAVPRNGKRVHVACVEGELHDLPARLVADYLDQHGFSVRYFGPDVPAQSLARAVEAVRPDLLALSATMSFHLPALRNAVREVRAVAPRLPIAVGGHAIGWSPNTVTDLAVATGPSDPDAVVALARTLTGLA